MYTLTLDRQPPNSGVMSIHKDRAISLSALALIFSELVQYQSIKICSAIDLELALERVGQTIGTKVLELLSYRESSSKRGDGVISILQFISSCCWKVLFGKVADSLERSTENENEYMIIDTEPMTNHFVSMPNHLGQLDCAAYMAGIIVGILHRAKFAARVSAHSIVGPGS